MDALLPTSVMGTMKTRQKEDEELSRDEISIKSEIEKLSKELKDKSERLAAQEEQVSSLKSEADTLSAKHVNNRALLDCAQNCISTLRLENERLKRRDEEERAKLDSFQNKCDSEIIKLRSKLDEYVAEFKTLPNVAEYESYQQEVMDLEAYLKQTRLLIEKQKQTIRRLHIDADVMIKSGCELAELHQEVCLKVSTIRSLHGRLRELKAIRNDRDAKVAAARQRRLLALVNRGREDFRTCAEQNATRETESANYNYSVVTMNMKELDPPKSKRVAFELMGMDTGGGEHGKANEKLSEIDEPMDANFESEFPINAGPLGTDKSEQEQSSQKGRDEIFEDGRSLSCANLTDECEKSAGSVDIAREYAEVASPKKSITKSVHFSTPDYVEFGQHSNSKPLSNVRDASLILLKPNNPEPAEMCSAAERDVVRNSNQPSFINFNDFLKQSAINKPFRSSATTVPHSILKNSAAYSTAGGKNIPKCNEGSGNAFFPQFRLGNTSS